MYFQYKLNYYINEENKLAISRLSLFDKVSLYCFDIYDSFEKFPHILSRELGVIKRNPVYEPFKKVSSLNWTTSDIEETIQALSDLKELNLSIEKYYFRACNLEEITKITNPDFFLK